MKSDIYLCVPTAAIVASYCVGRLILQNERPVAMMTQSAVPTFRCLTRLIRSSVGELHPSRSVSEERDGNPYPQNYSTVRSCPYVAS